MKPLLTGLLIIFSTVAIAEEAKPDRTTYTEVPLELKGVRLGMLYDEASTIFPGAECHHSKNLRGFSFCKNPKAQFADGKAKLEATFIDGVLVNIVYKNISFNKYQLLIDSLAAKYGAFNEDWPNGVSMTGGAKPRTFWRNSAQDTLNFSFPTDDEPTSFNIELIIPTERYNEFIMDRGPSKIKPKTDDI